jgi:carboxyl-terminal processing protease
MDKAGPVLNEVLLKESMVSSRVLPRLWVWGSILLCLAYPSIFARETKLVAAPGKARWESTIFEISSRIKEKGIYFASGEIPRFANMENVKAYLTAIDVYSDLLDAKEFTQFKRLSSDAYVGIGLEIQKDRQGRVVCVPHAGSSAAKAGVKNGDQLLSINRFPTTGRSLIRIAAAGLGGSKPDIELVIADLNERTKRILVKRGPQKYQSVIKEMVGTTPVIKLGAFTIATRHELEFLVDNWTGGDPITIDLRSNAGGDIHAAIDSAMLFLAKDEIIAKIKVKAEIKTYKATAKRTLGPSKIFLWQDAETASAAELFIAALTDNRRAISLGQRSFGKGTRQDIIPIREGQALVLTTGLLLTPKGFEFEGRGLEPMLPTSNDTANYIEAVSKCMRQDQHSSLQNCGT